MIYTIGHSTRPIEAFIGALRACHVTEVVDVRTVPGSRHNPQFSQDALRDALLRAGISYEHMAGLGGLRRPALDSPNTGWRNASFRGFADYMGTPGFEQNLGALVEMADRQRIAVMCAEAVPWRCHRSLIADALVVRGMEVEHIMKASETRPHRLTSWARVEGTKLTYPGEARTGAASGSP